MAFRQKQTMSQTHGFSEGAVAAAREALRAGRGRAAQFDHPELGGRGQWMPGMVMIGQMFDTQLRSRVNALFESLAKEPVEIQMATPGDASLRYLREEPDESWYPADLGRPGAAGSQGELRYAYFPGSSRLAVELRGRRAIYDTTGHRITGVSQAQGDAEGTVSFMSQNGIVRLTDLKQVG
ncbi:MAG TPA: hypothetical protein VGI81_28980 [Tepidisphaeraceae bacterium]|jgi:hypothetical protein